MDDRQLDAKPTAAAAGEALRYEVDTCDDERWHRILGGFADATIHQTGAWACLRWSEGKLSRVVVFAGEQPVAAAQVVIVSLPILDVGIAHCKFGPQWRLRGESEQQGRYEFILRALRETYAVERGLMLRIKPWELREPALEYRATRQHVGLRERGGAEQYETFVIDMSPSLDELRAGLGSKWRYNLKKSEKQALVVTQGTNPEAGQLFMQNYDEMRAIKSYVENSEVDILPRLLTDLPAALRPTVFTASHAGEPAASIVISHLGDVAYYLFGATGRLGRETGASYVLFWEALRWLKERQCKWFDLVGSRPDVTRGQQGYRQFKAGLVGRNGGEFSMRDWESCTSLVSRVAVNAGDRLRHGILSVKQGLNDVGRRVVSAASR